MGAASALGRDASILSPLSHAFERTRLERTDRTGAHFCFALAERSSQEAGPAQLVVVQGDNTARRHGAAASASKRIARDEDVVGLVGPCPLIVGSRAVMALLLGGGPMGNAIRMRPSLMALPSEHWARAFGSRRSVVHEDGRYR
jgi:hypothetical protein